MIKQKIIIHDCKNIEELNKEIEVLNESGWEIFKAFEPIPYGEFGIFTIIWKLKT